MTDNANNNEQPSIVQTRQVNNESVFREANEKVQKGLTDLAELAHSEGHGDLAPSQDMVLQFCCECSDENCRERIEMTLGEYARLHQDRNQFIVVPGHETANVETTIAHKKRFSLIRKFFKAPEKGASLKTTPTNNV